MRCQRLHGLMIALIVHSLLPVSSVWGSELEKLLGDTTLEEMHAAIELEVVSLYELQQKYILGSGKESTFAASDFITLRREGFKDVLYLEVLDPLEGDYLRRSTITTRLMEDELRTVLDPDWISAEMTQQMRGLSFEESLAFLESDMGLAQDSVLAVTSYRLSAWLEGQSRTYRAAVLWRRDQAGELDFAIVDNIGLLLPDDLSQLYPPADRSTYLAEVDSQREELIRAASEPPESDPSGTKASPACSPSVQVLALPAAWDSDDAEHDLPLFGSGQHEMSASGGVFCRCDSACVSHCVPEFASSCKDTGIAWRPNVGQVRHKTSEKKFDSPFVNGEGAAQCAAGFACVVKSCAGFCTGISISANLNAGAGIPTLGTVEGGVIFSFPLDRVLWDSQQFNWGAACPPCLRQVRVGVDVDNLNRRQDAVKVTLRNGSHSQELFATTNGIKWFDDRAEENDTVRLEVDPDEVECSFDGDNPSVVLVAGQQDLTAGLDCGKNHAVEVSGQWRDQPAGASATLTIAFEPPPGSWRSGYTEQVRLPDGFGQDLADPVSNRWSYTASVEVEQGEAPAKCSLESPASGTVTEPLTLEVVCEPDCDAESGGRAEGGGCSGTGSVHVQFYREPSFGDDRLDPGADITVPLQVHVHDMSSNTHTTMETTVSMSACATPSSGCFQGSWQVPYPELEVGDRVSLSIPRSSVTHAVEPETAECGLSDRWIAVEGEHVVTLTCGDRGRLGTIDYERNPHLVRPDRPLALDFRTPLADPVCRMRATFVRTGGYDITAPCRTTLCCEPGPFGFPLCQTCEFCHTIGVPGTERIRWRGTCFRPPARGPGEPVTTATSNFVEGWQLPQPALGGDYFAVEGVTFGPTPPAAVDLVFTNDDATRELVPVEVQTGLPSAHWCATQVPTAADCGASSGFFALFHEPELAAGQHELTVFAIDGQQPYNMWGSAGVLIDKQAAEPCAPPEVAITSPQEGSLVTLPALDIRGSVSGSGARIEMYREFTGGDDALLHSAPIDTLPLAFRIPYTVRAGTQTLRVEAINGCGATGRDRVTFSGDLSGACSGVTVPQMVFTIDGSPGPVTVDPGQTLSLVAFEAAPAQGSLSRIELLVDGELFGTFPATDGTPWSPMVPATLGAGTHLAEVRGYRLAPGSTCSLFGTASVVLEVTDGAGSCSADDLAPQVTISSPAAGQTATAGQPLPIEVSASDAGGVARIEISVDGGSGAQVLASQSFPAAPVNAGLQAPWTPGEGVFQLLARAEDACGNVASDQVTLSTVSACAADTQPPAVAITYPAAGAQLLAGDVVTFRGTASDNLGLQAVEILASGTLLGAAVLDPADSTWSLSWTATEGWHQVSARAIDSCGLVTTSEPLPVAVGSAQPCGIGNQPPSLSLSVHPDRLPPSATAELIAVASDADGDPLSVCFSAPGQSLGCLATPPYRTTWTAPAAAGIETVDLTAEVSDGCETRPATVTVTVDPCGDPAGPDVVTSSPDDGMQFEDGQFIHFRARASDPQQVGSVAFYYDGTLIGTQTTAETTANGLHLYKNDFQLPLLGLEDGQRMTKTLRVTARPPGAACQNLRSSSVDIEIFGGIPDPDIVPE